MTLEIGCGEGRVAPDLAARGHEVTGIDAAPSMIKAARLADPDGTYLVADRPRFRWRQVPEFLTMRAAKTPAPTSGRAG